MDTRNDDDSSTFEGYRKIRSLRMTIDTDYLQNRPYRRSKSRSLTLFDQTFLELEIAGAEKRATQDSCWRTHDFIISIEIS